MALHLHRAERTDLLADGLAALLAELPPDPFAEELVLVPARGIERWLSQRLSHALGCGPHGDDGVCAGVLFRSPGSLIAAITGTVDDDPWSPDAMTWPLLQAIDASLDVYKRQPRKRISTPTTSTQLPRSSPVPPGRWASPSSNYSKHRRMTMRAVRGPRRSPTKSNTVGGPASAR